MYSSKFPFIFLFLIAFNVSSQEGNYATNFASIIDSIALKRIVYTLADDSLLGRETAEIGQKKAEKFIVSEFERIGIDKGNNGSYLQNYNVINQELNNIEFKVGSKVFNNNTQLFTYNNNKDIDLTASNLIFAGYGISSEKYDDYTYLNIENKIIFVINGSPEDNEGIPFLSEEEETKWFRNYSLKTEVAFEKGAKAIVFVKENFKNLLPKYINYLSRQGLSLVEGEDSQLEAFPQILMSDSSFYTLFNTTHKGVKEYLLLKGGNRKEEKLEVKAKAEIRIKCNKKRMSSSNILAKVTTSDTLAPWIVLSAHYDHVGFDSIDVYNGADDNASGTAAVIEMASVFNKAKNNGMIFNKNILFLLVSGEEKGLLGSRYYTLNPIVDLSRTMVNLNIDMIGRVDEKHEDNSDYIYVIGSDKISQRLHDINEEVNNTYTKFEFDYTYNMDDDPNRFYYRSDHYNFAKNNIPVIFYFNGVHEDYHRYTDTADKIVFDALLKRTKLVFHTAWYLATMEGVLMD